MCSVEGCDEKVWARGMCRTDAARATGEDKRHPRHEYPCSVCGTPVMRAVDNARIGKHCCSPECRRIRQHGDRQHTGATYDLDRAAVARAREHGITEIEWVDRDKVFARDSWLCYLCGGDTSQATNPFDPHAATVDHVVPLSKGGPHTMANVRCCCLRCNTSKRDGERLAPSVRSVA